MASSIEKDKLRSMLEGNEGRVYHMYLDSNGFITIGAGHLLSSFGNAQKLAFKTDKNKPASNNGIKIDYENVKKQTAGRVASYYKKHTKLTISDTEINKLTDEHIESFEKELKNIYSGFSTFPINVRLALFDLIFNVGATDLRKKWPNLNAAIKARDWQKAADNSNRKPPVSATRNNFVKRLFEKAANTAKKAKSIAKDK